MGKERKEQLYKYSRSIFVQILLILVFFSNILLPVFLCAADINHFEPCDLTFDDFSYVPKQMQDVDY